jgi:DNA-binding response OmpR family regulator
MSKRRILVIEDDAAIREVIVDALNLEGYDTVQGTSFTEGLRLATQVRCDLVLLDLVLPGGDGLELLTQVRLAHPTLPVIIATARAGEADRVRGLKLGADDYVVKPFSIKEVLARVQAVLRRSAERPSDLTELRIVGGLADLSRCELRFDDGEVTSLTEREVALLRYLARNASRTISREELLERVWNLPSNQLHTRTIDMTVARLREKLRAEESIHTVRGRGYRFEAP